MARNTCPFCNHFPNRNEAPRVFGKPGERMFRYVCSFAGCTVKPQSEWKDSDTEASDAWDNRPYDRAIRNQAIDECASAFDLAAKNFQDDHAAILSMRSPVAGSMLSLLFGMADSLRHLIVEEAK